ncbi:type I glutamate--ammonia ligase [Tepidibacillus sp. HK-1]|uniref:type I glutamate--ammonia ligase n=1 Tax=Tepidibacillus sp. HK-1 TaxID=1883407 RepID=UPI0008562F6D|nr:type I glutamate--ammonia ligase [Tepidibacillus sp. HK-1]GBF11359.1 glutamine synthetase [Tepidibacillus sp. HK-1]
MASTLELNVEQQAKELIWKKVKEHNIEFIRLIFTDIFGFAKNMTIHKDELDDAMNGKLMFDGSSIDGFARIEESDMYLKPDLTTFQVFPLRPNEKSVAHFFCDVYGTDGKPFMGCPRNTLKRVLKEAEEMGYQFNVGAEGEFFLFYRDEKGEPIFNIHDHAGYFDLSPIDKGEDARQDIILTMKKFGFHIEAAHHEVAPGQHEVDFKYGDALSIADKWMMFKMIVKNIANKHGLYASFIPKPFANQNGNAMHCNQSLQDKEGNNVFYDKQDPLELSKITKNYIGGLLNHAKGMAAITNPTINSYKRLIPGFEAPTNISWSRGNRSALIRIPHARGKRTRIELRNPDPTANPYLVFAVMLKAGLEGIKKGMTPPEEFDGDVTDVIENLPVLETERYPRDLHSALEYMRKDILVKEVMGEHAFTTYIEAKQLEADQFAREVHHWEIDQYLKKY